MSAPSGIKVPPSLASAFSTAQNGGQDVRALVFVIEGESFKHLTTVAPKSTFQDDIALLPETLPSPTTPASFAYRLDSKEGGKYEWMMITFVPDTAGVRAKMLQASSRGGLLKALGGNFKHDWFANSIKDLTPSALSAHLKHLASPAPLSAAEKALMEVREAEAVEAKRAALDPDTEKRRIAAVMGLGGKMKWDEEVSGAMRKVAERSDEGWIVVLEIPPKDASAITLVLSSACKPSELSSKLPAKSPSYVFYSFPTPAPPPSSPVSGKKWSAGAAAPGDTFHASEGGRRTVATTWKAGADEKKDDEKEGEEAVKEMGDLSVEDKEKEGKSEKDEGEKEEVSASPAAEKPASPVEAVKTKGRVIFIYSCPSGSPVKLRMVYSTSVRGVQQDAADKAGVEVVGKLETSDVTDLTESQLRSALPSTSKPHHSNSLPTPSSSTSTSSSSTGFGSTANKSAFGAPAPAFGGAFGRPRPVQPKKQDSLSSVSTASGVPLPSSGPTTPAVGNEEDGDGKEGIRRAFDAFGPRVGGAGGGGGFARPKPAGRR
ncbi:uncharacterized protein MKK02DRAFT_42435 [Dioszegia hungarica]|uniref:ADF-H domain-containing protein n=1 Tax=Dioszegia hungarica TaxID=4972 RepID=A0AA38LWM8_9TREE|nr:uncharacterized protein MKK02DRAFT_42435 [Dioszegia hungarica]KAI9638053.1 hypothetical protein MKK02DRAFT_42435 [Dioszegia hungarica]